MKHIITGGDGFLGTELAKKLVARGEKVLAIDIKKTESPHYDDIDFMMVDITDKAALETVPVDADDIVYHFAARLLVPIIKRADRQEYFWSVLYQGTENLLDYLEQKTGCRKVIYYTTDMVYGHTVENPRPESHPRVPLGPYGNAKYQSELLCEKYRERGFNITLFRPRLIIGPGRLGILESLFKLIDKNLPVPTIGGGRNFYQFISVSDCADICLAAVEKGVPNEAYNVGSLGAPRVRALLNTLIKSVGSKSIVVPTPAFAVKFVLAILDKLNIPLLDPEQYLIADETCILSMEKAKNELDWEPKDSDSDMLLAAYVSWKESLKGDGSGS
ncbi:NAD-dependent dehydratase [Chromatiales bacterium (ex Bugula neritina AB1)]|nr:NAD-dependent dehydratase [Chromatiales bacterium (ex Bugula neritina AB1)]